MEVNLRNQIKEWEEKYLYPLIPCMMHNKTVIFLRGISGSGKTTLSNTLLQILGPETVSYSADNYFIIDGVYTFDRNKISEAHISCVKSMETALQSPKIRYIIMDNTHTQLWHLQNAEDIANKYGANLYYLDIYVPDKAHFLL
jgi:predicted kinase